MHYFSEHGNTDPPGASMFNIYMYFQGISKHEQTDLNITTPMLENFYIKAIGLDNISNMILKTVQNSLSLG